jgi:hypothetical protein
MFSFIVLFMPLLQASSYVPPRVELTAPFQHPVNMIQNSWVVVDLPLDQQGSIQSIKALYGGDPFLSLAASSLKQWRFSPARNPTPTDAQVTVVFLYRSREIFPLSPLRLARSLQPDVNGPPRILEMSDPGYPAPSVGEGPTIVELQINAEGNVDGSRVIVDIPGLAAHTEQALQSWKFQPAMRDGKPATGTVIAVISYLRPVIGPVVAPR